MATYPAKPTDQNPREQQSALPPGRLWRQLSVERRQEVARAFWSDAEGGAQQAEALVWMAKQLNFRVKTLQHEPLDRKVQHLATLRGVPDTVAVRALVAYHLATKREMMGAFLDALGIPHENGLIAGEDVKAPDEQKLADAARQLREKYPPEDVHIYFSTLYAQDPDTWGGLEKLLDQDAAAADDQGGDSK